MGNGHLSVFIIIMGIIISEVKTSIYVKGNGFN